MRLTQSAVAALRMHRRRRLDERMYKTDLWQERGLDFPSTVGTTLWGGSLNRAFKATLQRAGLPKCTHFHVLRHTCATLLLKQGVHPTSCRTFWGTPI